MRLSRDTDHLRAMVCRQVDNLFFLEDGEESLVADLLGPTLDRVEACFAPVRNKYYRREGEVFFNVLHSGQYFIFLYWLSRAARESGQGDLADKLYALNKSLSACDLFHEVDMPRVFFADHPVGSVMGRASYGDCFAFNQNCTVGNNHAKYPTIGEHVTLFSGAKVLGDAHIGDHCILSANTYVKDQDVPPFSVVYGTSPHLVIRRMDLDYYRAVSRFDAD